MTPTPLSDIIKSATNDELHRAAIGCHFNSDSLSQYRQQSIDGLNKTIRAAAIDELQQRLNKLK